MGHAYYGLPADIIRISDGKHFTGHSAYSFNNCCLSGDTNANDAALISAIADNHRGTFDSKSCGGGPSLKYSTETFDAISFFVRKCSKVGRARIAGKRFIIISSVFNGHRCKSLV